jgi:hypothetical protein
MRTHPERVAAAVPDDCKVVALLHDAVEDGHVSLGAAGWALRPDEGEALLWLTRTDSGPYASYIDMIAVTKGRAGRIARTVKIADLRDNLYGRPEGPPPESLRKRYEKALAVLEAAA